MHFPRPACTAIYFLLTSSATISHLHRIPVPEFWTHLEGDPLLIAEVEQETAEYSERVLAPIGTRLNGENDTRDTQEDEDQRKIDGALLRPTSTAASVADAAAAAASSSSPVDALHLLHNSPGTQLRFSRRSHPRR
jgi:hypothetical protein